MQTTTVVVGAGHAGLAVSHCLAARGIDHVVIERGEVAHTWRTERWDSLRLLTPNWQTKVPGLAYDGDDPDGFMTMAEVVAFIERYARLVAPPLETGTTVESLTRNGDGYEVVTDRGAWLCQAVVIASGGFNVPKLPPVAAALPGGIESVTPMDYTRPQALPEGGALVVGASATGVQIADEVHRSGRPVTLAVGEHVRMPRTYRGKDILWWMDRTGLHDERYDEVDDIVRARRVPSPQLVGTPERATLNINNLTDLGVRLVGSLAGFADGKAQFSGSLRNKCTLADLKQGRLLATIDEWVDENGRDDGVEPPHRFEPTRVEESPPLTLDLAQERDPDGDLGDRIRADHSWIDLPVFDHKGRLRHDGGVVTGAPGVYRIGLNFPAPPQVELHPRDRGRRPRPDGPPGRIRRSERPLVLGFRPAVLVRLHEVDPRLQGLEHPRALAADVAVVVLAEQPDCRLDAVHQHGGRHDDPPLAPRGVAWCVHVDPLVHHEVAGEDDLRRDVGEEGADRLASLVAVEVFAAIPDPVLRRTARAMPSGFVAGGTR